MRPTRLWFDTPGVRWRVVVGVVLAATALFALWLSNQRELWSAQEVAIAVAPRLVAAASAASAAPVRLAAAVAPAASRSAARVVVPPLNTDACGHPIADADAGDDGAAPERRSRVLRERWIAAMQTSGDDRSRAAGWLLGLSSANAPLRDRLATLAATSSDPLVLAFALRACRGDSGGSSACQALSPESWASLEGDNAAAWLAVATDPRVEPAVQLDALQRASQATRLDSHAAALHPLVQAAAPAGTGEADRVAMAREVAGARADWLGSEALRTHCSIAFATDLQRAQVCGRLAELFASQAQTVPDLQQARELGQRLGWKDERLDALRDEAEALAALAHRIAEPDAASDCAALQRQSGFYAEVGRFGEVAALRQAMKR